MLAGKPVSPGFGKIFLDVAILPQMTAVSDNSWQSTARLWSVITWGETAVPNNE
ncbi:MAG: hypothetical protein ACE5FD_15315 [Anaerolineae bacterium]